jgi:hypothetical protein
VAVLYSLTRYYQFFTNSYLKLGQWHSSCNRPITAVTLPPRGGFEAFQRHHLTSISFPPLHPGDLYLNHHIRFRHVQVGAKQEIILLRTKDPQVNQYIAPGRALCPSAYLSILSREAAHPQVVFARFYPQQTSIDSPASTHLPSRRTIYEIKASNNVDASARSRRYVVRHSPINSI